MTFLGGNGLVVVPQGGPPGPLGPIGPAGPNIYAFKTLFVSKGGWPIGANPLVYFTDIQLALNQGAALGPTKSAPVGIIVFPGEYPENLTLVSNVSLFGGAGRQPTRLLGDITWNAGQGVNAGSAGLREDIGLQNLRMIGSNFNVDTTAKTADLSVLHVTDCSIPDVYTGVNRPGVTIDYLQSWNSLFTDMTVTSGVVDIHDAEFGAFSNVIVFNGACDVGFNNCQVFQDVTMNDASANGTGIFDGCYFDANVTLNNTRGMRFVGSQIKGNLVVAAGAYADIRSSEVPQANISGAGQIDRRATRITTAATVFGVNAIVISPPLSTNNYNVALSLVSGPGGNPVLITNKLGTGFDLDDPTGGNVWDLTIIQD